MRGTTVEVRLKAQDRSIDETISVKVPPGVNEGSKVRVRGKGNVGPGGRGDLIILTHVGEHAYFKREGNDILLDLPVPWFNWSRQLLSAAEVVLVTGQNTIPGLRRVAESLAAVRAVERVPARVAVVLNRCEYGLVGGIARRQHVKNLLGEEEVFYVRDDLENAVQSVNTGIPMTVQGQGKVSKDIAPIALLVSEAKPIPAAGSRS